MIPSCGSWWDILVFISARTQVGFLWSRKITHNITNAYTSRRRNLLRGVWVDTNKPKYEHYRCVPLLHARLSLFKQLKKEINQVSKSTLRAFEITREAVKLCETAVVSSVGRPALHLTHNTLQYNLKYSNGIFFPPPKTIFSFSL